MRIGITGVTGLIGEAVASLARDQGHQVVAYTRRAQAEIPLAAEVLTQPAEFPGALPETQIDALVHLGGESLMGLWTRAKRERLWSSRVDTTRALVDHLGTWRPESRPKVLVCASGIGAYGDRGEEILDESSPRGKGFLAELCHAWEAAACAAERLGIRVVNLRSGMVLSREGGALPLLRRLFSSGLGGKLGSGRQWLSWIHVRDEAGVVLWAIGNERVRGPLNACAPDGVTNAVFTRMLAAKLRRPAVIPAPAVLLRLALRGMADEMLLCSQHAIPRVARELGYTFRHPDLNGALGALIGN
ncbi:MAG: TIGR01777 family oxidoreductase [Prosthecobacter sp.]|nr:TIGR01777 family oxidoreductase [Prosthecobacter sp.]